jgi:cytochrome bd ubiquinol oxidase subunit II
MELFWFCVIAFMLTMYVILDGFDLGAGAIHLWAARSDDERRTILAAIGPVWDGNEVWLIATAAVLYFAFPPLYAAAFSGFYLPLMIVLWLLMLRGLGIEFRRRIEDPIWRTFWDAVFFLGSFLLTIVFGAALGNVVRGVPLNAEGYFFEPLWTTFTIVPESGILDWFTVLMGLVALCTLTMHGAFFIAMKTTGPLQDRARFIALRAWWGALAGSAAAIAAVTAIRPVLWNNFGTSPWGWIFPLAGAAGLIAAAICGRRRNDAAAFFSSAAFIAGMLGATAFGLYPYLLPATTDDAHSLTVHNSAAGAYGLGVGSVWYAISMILALGYLVFVLRMHRGKLKPITSEFDDPHY